MIKLSENVVPYDAIIDFVIFSYGPELMREISPLPSASHIIATTDELGLFNKPENIVLDRLEKEFPSIKEKWSEFQKSDKYKNYFFGRYKIKYEDNFIHFDTKKEYEELICSLISKKLTNYEIHVWEKNIDGDEIWFCPSISELPNFSSFIINDKQTNKRIKIEGFEKVISLIEFKNKEIESDIRKCEIFKRKYLDESVIWEIDTL